MVPRLAMKDDPMTKLSDTQSIILSAAAQRADGNVLPLPGSLRGGAATKVVAALLSRGLAGLRGATLVVNLPGSPGGCRDGFAVLQPALRHGLELATGDRSTAHRQT